MVNVEFLGVEITFRQLHKDLVGAINLGGMTLRKEGREYMLDTVSSKIYPSGDGGTTVECSLDSVEGSKETFGDGGYDLTENDLMSRNLDLAELFIEFEDDTEKGFIDYEGDVESITLYTRHGYKDEDNRGLTLCTNLTPESFEIVE